MKGNCPRMYQVSRMSKHMDGYANAHSLWSKETLLTGLPSFILPFTIRTRLDLLSANEDKMHLSLLGLWKSSWSYSQLYNRLVGSLSLSILSCVEGCNSRGHLSWMGIRDSLTLLCSCKNSREVEFHLVKSSRASLRGVTPG